MYTTAEFLNIIGNISTNDWGGGAALSDNSGLRNCLIVSNIGGGIRFRSGTTNHSVNNCTIAANIGTGAYWESNCKTSIVINTIIYQNSGSSSNWYILSSPTVFFTNCCTAPLTGLTGAGNIDSSPAFADTNMGNYRLSSISPCINTGMNQDWMTNAVDLDGRMRIRYGIVDIGAYETIYKGAIFTFP